MTLLLRRLADQLMTYVVKGRNNANKDDWSPGKQTEHQRQGAACWQGPFAAALKAVAANCPAPAAAATAPAEPCDCAAY